MLLPEDEKCSYNKAVQALKKRFKPTDIEELHGIEFNQKMQKNESIAQLGIELQNLGRKAFPRMKEEDFDHLLKGRFFQALLSKWQRKLSAPKPGETFSELYDRARTLEKQDKQISATAAFRGDNKGFQETLHPSQPVISLIEVVEVTVTLCSMGGHKTDRIRIQEDAMFVVDHIEPENAPTVQRSQRHQEEPMQLHDLPNLQQHQLLHHRCPTLLKI